MPIYKTDRGYRVKVNYKDPFGNYKSKTSTYFKTKREAQEQEIIILNELKNNYSGNSSTTFKEVYESFLLMKKSTVKLTTYMTYKPLWSHCKQLANIKIKDFNISQYNAFKETIDKKNISIGRKNKIHRFIKSLIKYGQTQYDINNNILNKMIGFKNPNAIRVKNINFYTYEEFKLFISNVNNDIYNALFTLLYYQGLRLGEANGLTWNDIDFNKHELSVNKTVCTKIKGLSFFVTSTKKKASDRVLPLEEETERKLLKLKTYWQTFNNFKNDWFVFGGVRPLAESNIHNIKNKASAKAKLKRIRIHDFRHSCASFLINIGCPPNVVQKYLGHANLSITLDTYSHLYPSALIQATKLIKKFKDKN